MIDPTKNDLNIGCQAGQRDSEAVKLVREIAQARTRRDAAREDFECVSYCWEIHESTIEPYKKAIAALESALVRAVEFARKDTP